ncbi:MAG: nitroreductase family deazaflavin-dependent oxidoreductase [Acidimicrobiales bacterium]
MANLKDLFAKSFTSVHETVFRMSNGRIAGRAGGMPVVLLTTTGRKSGKSRNTMLTSPVQDGDSIVLVASYGGDDRHPAWFLNLRDNPDVEAVMNGSKRSMRASIATGDERAELWERLTAKYKGYAGYQEKTDREIPVVVLSPRLGSGASETN